MKNDNLNFTTTTTPDELWTLYDCVTTAVMYWESEAVKAAAKGEMKLKFMCDSFARDARALEAKISKQHPVLSEDGEASDPYLHAAENIRAFGELATKIAKDSR